MGVMPELILSWKGVDYRCRTTMDVIMHIEDKVSLSRLANRCLTGAKDGDIPNSHVAWVYFCLLQGGGAVISIEDVWKELKDNGISIQESTKVMQFVITEVYGAGPSSPDDLEVEEKK